MTKATILVVDDDQIEVLLSTTWLQNAGYEVLQAASGDEAADILRTGTHIDLVLTDWNMPGSRLDGIGLAKLAGALHPELPVVLRTTNHEAADHVPSVIPPITIIYKAYSPKNLPELVGRLLKQGISTLGQS
jgi:CheY-like chemotaxis protein